MAVINYRGVSVLDIQSGERRNILNFEDREFLFNMTVEFALNQLYDPIQNTSDYNRNGTYYIFYFHAGNHYDPFPYVFHRNSIMTNQGTIRTRMPRGNYPGAGYYIYSIYEIPGTFLFREFAQDFGFVQAARRRGNGRPLRGTNWVQENARAAYRQRQRNAQAQQRQRNAQAQQRQRNAQQRPQDAQQRQRNAQQRQRNAQQRPQNAQQRQRNAQQRPRNAQQRPRNAQQRQRNVQQTPRNNQAQVQENAVVAQRLGLTPAQRARQRALGIPNNKLNNEEALTRDNLRSYLNNNTKNIIPIIEEGFTHLFNVVSLQEWVNSQRRAGRNPTNPTTRRPLSAANLRILAQKYRALQR